ncbi:MAG: sugar nucleotide-binding protein [Thermoplasmata archaeon]
MTDLLVFGSSSLVGSHFVMTTRHRVMDMGQIDPRAEKLPVVGFAPIDLTDAARVEEAVRRSNAEVVVNFAAATDVDAVERERPRSPEGAQGPAFLINAAAPEAMARATRETGKFLVSLSTDFVFDGVDGPYSEDAGPMSFSPKLSWYGWTKGEGERRVRAINPAAAVVRIAYPYRASHSGKLDFARKIVDGHRRRALPPYFSDQQITPTWVPDVSRALEFLIDGRKAGVFHVASPTVTSPYLFARELLLAIEHRPPELTEGSLKQFLARPGTTPRPIRGGLRCTRLPAAGLQLTDWRDGIRQFAAERGDAG